LRPLGFLLLRPPGLFAVLARTRTRSLRHNGDDRRGGETDKASDLTRKLQVEVESVSRGSVERLSGKARREARRLFGLRRIRVSFEFSDLRQIVSEIRIW
jgi:hypothetical protein